MRICLLHDEGWSGKNVEYGICEFCKLESLFMYENSMMEGMSIKGIMERKL